MFLNNRRKGFTLYELTIVLAIIAIVSTLVVNYVTFLSNYSNSVKEDNDAMSEIYTYKVMVERWFSYFDKSSYTFTTKTEKDSSDNDVVIGLTASISGSSGYSVYYEDNYIYLQYDKASGYGSSVDGENYNQVQLTANSITSLTFSSYDDSGNLWRCTVGCESGDVTFLLERHVEYSSSS